MIAACATCNTVFSPQEIHQIADRAWRAGDGVQQLLKRKRAMVARVRLESGRSVIAKLWCAPGIYALVRRKFGTSNCQSAWKAMAVLHDAGVAVPCPLGQCIMVTGPYTEAMLVEDLGNCVLGIDHVKKLVREGREADHEQFVDEIFELTEAMLSHNVLDPDHGLHNILVRADGRPMRIDFEVAKIVRGQIGTRAAYGEMMGRLLTSYVFAVQPDASRIEKFARRIEKDFAPPKLVLQRAGKYVRDQLAKQSATMGVHTQVRLDW